MAAIDDDANQRDEWKSTLHSRAGEASVTFTLSSDTSARCEISGEAAEPVSAGVMLSGDGSESARRMSVSRAEQHAGVVKCSSNGDGARFTITLPVAEP